MRGTDLEQNYDKIRERLHVPDKPKANQSWDIGSYEKFFYCDRNYAYGLFLRDLLGIQFFAEKSPLWKRYANMHNTHGAVFERSLPNTALMPDKYVYHDVKGRRDDEHGFMPTDSLWTENVLGFRTGGGFLKDGEWNNALTVERLNERSWSDWFFYKTRLVANGQGFGIPSGAGAMKACHGVRFVVLTAVFSVVCRPAGQDAPRFSADGGTFGDAMLVCSEDAGAVDGLPAPEALGAAESVHSSVFPPSGSWLAADVTPIYWQLNVWPALGRVYVLAARYTRWLVDTPPDPIGVKRLNSTTSCRAPRACSVFGRSAWSEFDFRDRCVPRRSRGLKEGHEA